MDSSSLRFNLHECLKDVSIAMSPFAEQKGIELIQHVDLSVPAALVGDLARLRQVLVSLAGDAIKFSSQGQIAICVRAVKKTANEALLHFIVRGARIEPPADRNGEESFGPGLPACQLVVSQMDGRMWAEDGPHNLDGAFHFTARFGLDQEAAARLVTQGEPSNPLEILLAEDNRVNQMIAVRLLEKRGHRVRVVGDGREALEIATRLKFDLILMDIQMPGMDGLQATVAIRDSEKASGSRLPIVALTAHTTVGDKRRCVEAGMDAFVCKPIDSRDLFKTIEEILIHAER